MEKSSSEHLEALGKVAFEAYWQHAKLITSLTEVETPTWDDLNADVQLAWQASASTAVKHVSNYLVQDVLKTDAGDNLLKYIRNNFTKIFELTFSSIQVLVHEIDKEKSPWIVAQNNQEFIGLIHNDLWKALEALRYTNPADENIPEFSSAEISLADAVTRIMVLAQERGFNIGSAIVAKAQLNKLAEKIKDTNLSDRK